MLLLLNKCLYIDSTVNINSATAYQPDRITNTAEMFPFIVVTYVTPSPFSFWYMRRLLNLMFPINCVHQSIIPEFLMYPVRLKNNGETLALTLSIVTFKVSFSSQMKISKSFVQPNAVFFHQLTLKMR